MDKSLHVLLSFWHFTLCAQECFTCAPCTCSWRSEEGIRSSGTGVKNGWATMWSWELNPGPLQQQKCSEPLSPLCSQRGLEYLPLCAQQKQQYIYTLSWLVLTVNWHSRTPAPGRTSQWGKTIWIRLVCGHAVGAGRAGCGPHHLMAGPQTVQERTVSWTKQLFLLLLTVGAQRPTVSLSPCSVTTMDHSLELQTFRSSSPLSWYWSGCVITATDIKLEHTYTRWYVCVSVYMRVRITNWIHLYWG